MSPRRPILFSGLMVLLAAGLPALRANSPDPIPTNMSGGGTSGSPAQYIVDTASVNQGSSTITLGSSSAYNDLTIENGYSLTTGGSINIGTGPSGKNNYALVTGSNSVLNAGNAITLGFFGGSNNTLAITGGGLAACGATAAIGIGNSGNTVSVADFGSTFLTSSLTIGANSGTGNTLQTKNGALVEITSGLTVNSGNAILIDGGFLAWSGDHTTDFANMVASGALEYSTDGTTYQTGDASNFSYQYFDSLDSFGAEAFSGYSGLGGYTILTSVSPIPEPAADALGVGLLALGMVGWRRRRLRSAQTRGGGDAGSRDR